MPNRKVIASPLSVVEAQAIQSILAASEIESQIDNAVTGGILPLHTLSMGGVTVSVWEKDAEHARQLLSDHEGAIPADAEAQAEAKVQEHLYTMTPEETEANERSKRFKDHFQLAMGAAIFGSIGLPGLSGLYSFYQFYRAYQVDPKRLRQRWVVVAICSIFNVVFAPAAIVVYPVLYRAFVDHLTWIFSSR